MITVHYYVSRKYGINEFMPACTREWTRPTNFTDVSKVDSWGNGRARQLNFTTTKAKVTCKECLNILIPKLQATIDAMRANMEAAP